MSPAISPRAGVWTVHRQALISSWLSSAITRIVFEILKIDGGKPGENPIVTFSVKNKKGEPIDAGKMTNLRLVVAWPTMDYKVAVEEDARKALTHR